MYYLNITLYKILYFIYLKHITTGLIYLQIVDGGYRIMDSEEGDELGDDNLSDPPSRHASHSPSVSSPASDSPTPTNSVHEKNWSRDVHHSHWQGLSKYQLK